MFYKKTLRLVLPGLAVLLAMPGLRAGSLDEKLIETEAYVDFGMIAAPIMTEDETKAFRHLTNDMQKLVFIQKFWERRDPDPETPVNEFRQQYMEKVNRLYKRYSKGARGFKSHQAIVHMVIGAPNERRTFFSRRGGPVEVWTYWSTPNRALPPQYSIVFSNDGLRRVLFTTYPGQTRSELRLNSTGGLSLAGLPYDLARAVEEINQASIVNPSTPS